MKVHMVSYDFGQKKCQNPKFVHIYGQKDLKTAIVIPQTRFLVGTFFDAPYNKTTLVSCFSLLAYLTSVLCSLIYMYYHISLYIFLSGPQLSLLASEYFNSTEVSTMYFLICWGLFISN